MEWWVGRDHMTESLLGYRKPQSPLPLPLSSTLSPHPHPQLSSTHPVYQAMHVFQVADNQADIPNDPVILLQKVADVHNQTFSSLPCRIKKHLDVGNYWQEGREKF